MHDGSKMEDYISHEGELTLARSVIIRGHVVRMIESQLRANSDQFVGPISDADRMLRVLRRKARPAANFVIEIFVPNCKEGARQQPEHSVIDDRPLRRVTV